MPKLQMVDALRLAIAGATEKQLQMLRFHFTAPKGKVTARMLATEVGYASSKGANLQYGLFAGEVAEYLGVKTGFNVEVLAEINGKDTEGEFFLVMLPEVRKALKQLGWRPLGP